MAKGECDTTHKSFWNKLWALKLPSKVTLFLWHVCTGCLPAAVALSSKQIVHCACWNEIETDTHVLFTCDFARTVWAMTEVQQGLQVLPYESAFKSLLKTFEVCTRGQCVQMGIITWDLWSGRNKWVWERVNGSAFGVKITERGTDSKRGERQS